MTVKPQTRLLWDKHAHACCQGGHLRRDCDRETSNACYNLEESSANTHDSPWVCTQRQSVRACVTISNIGLDWSAHPRWNVLISFDIRRASLTTHFFFFGCLSGSAVVVWVWWAGVGTTSRSSSFWRSKQMDAFIAYMTCLFACL